MGIATGGKAVLAMTGKSMGRNTISIPPLLMFGTILFADDSNGADKHGYTQGKTYTTHNRIQPIGEETNHSTTQTTANYRKNLFHKASPCQLV